MQEDDVKDYLKNNPNFFEENAHILANIYLPSPHGEGTISLAERQQLAQRDKITALEERYAELVLNAQENDAIANKIHAFNLCLHKATNFDAIEQLISGNMPEHFELSDTCLRIWAKPSETSTGANLVFSQVADETKEWISILAQPYCGEPTDIVTEDWFIDPAASVAIIPLRDEQTIGFLALASDDKNRFFPGMGTDFLTKISEIVSAALTRYVNPN